MTLLPGGIYFEVVSQLGKRVRITKRYWEKIIKDKHPVMGGKEHLEGDIGGS